MYTISDKLNEELEQFEVACREGDEAKALQLVSEGLSLTESGGHVYAPFHLACMYGMQEVVRLGLDGHWFQWWNSLANLRAKTGETALHLACKGDQLPVARMLLEKGADPALRDASGRFPLQNAIGARLLAFLLNYGALLPLPNAEAQYCLRQAVAHGRLRTVRLFLERGVSPNGAPPGHASALHVACRINVPEIVQVLLDRGAWVDHQDARGFTALHDAVQFEQIKVIRQLMDAGADTSLRDHQGRTPIHLALERADEGSLKALNQRSELNPWIDAAPEGKVIHLSEQSEDLYAPRTSEDKSWLSRRFHFIELHPEASERDIRYLFSCKDISFGVQPIENDLGFNVYFLDPVMQQPVHLFAADERELQSTLEEAEELRRLMAKVEIDKAGIRRDATGIKRGHLYWDLQRFLDICKEQVIEEMVVDSHSAEPQHVRSYLTHVLDDHGILHRARGDARDPWSFYGKWVYGGNEETVEQFLARLKLRLVRGLHQKLNLALHGNIGLRQELTVLLSNYLTGFQLGGYEREELARLQEPGYRRLEALETLRRSLLAALRTAQVPVDKVRRWHELSLRAGDKREIQKLEQTAGVRAAGLILADLHLCEKQLANCRRRLRDTKIAFRELPEEWVQREGKGLVLTFSGVFALGRYLGFFCDK